MSRMYSRIKNKEPETDHDATNPADTTSFSPSVSSGLEPEPEPKMAAAAGTADASHSAVKNKDHEKQSPEAEQTPSPVPKKSPEAVANPAPEITKLTKKITTHPTLTPLRKRLYLCLLSIPPGSWTTYAALAKYTGTSARAVGTAMRLNPFAPGVPCHRVLGSDGGLGGYMGTPPAKQVKGKGNLGKKRDMLEHEGVMFDEKGKAMGRAFVSFTS